MIICGAGAAAHLAGVCAAETELPVLGVPLASSDLAGLDALLATVQMPAGVPVGTLAIGKAGARNAGLLAARIIARAAPGGGRAGPRPARADGGRGRGQGRRAAGEAEGPLSAVGLLDRYLAREILLPMAAGLLFLTQLLLATQILAQAAILFGAGRLRGSTSGW